jgi:hypothetical protein
MTLFAEIVTLSLSPGNDDNNTQARKDEFSVDWKSGQAVTTPPKNETIDMMD